MTRRARSGFTLIELIIVVAIIGVLAVVLVAVLLSAQGKGEIGKAEYFVKNVIPAAMGKWQDDNGKGDNEYPRSGRNSEGDYVDGNPELYEALVTGPEKAGKGSYVPKDTFGEGEVKSKPGFLDPWNQPYIYRNYTAKLSKAGGDKPYRGKKHNEAYDIISKGPDGQIDTEDDIYLGAE
ncbi:MAG: prepilin-type N-terminal cleavage/methylation domain-containing protein [Planctomycetes bacterium]|nr:prepilin-type N-terminal cleavage/methylation domain-containing protein [Planctomycetota bacterium]